MHKILLPALLLLAACSAGSNIIQGNEAAVTVRSYGGNFGDQGATLARQHCGQYGKVAVPDGGTGPYIAGAFSYLCR